jgi:hypothetical protein
MNSVTTTESAESMEKYSQGACIILQIAKMRGLTFSLADTGFVFEKRIVDIQSAGRRQFT